MTSDGAKKTRSFYYRRFHWAEVESSEKTESLDQTLESLMRTAHANLKLSHERIFNYSAGMLQGMDCRLNREELLIHIAYYTPDQPASLVPVPSSTVSVLNTTEEKPPAGHNFMEGDLFILIHGNDVILCPSGLHENAALHYISWMLENGTSLDVDANRYIISAVTDLDKAQLISREGVKSLSFGTSLYTATLAHENRKNSNFNPIKSVQAFALALFGEDDTVSLAKRERLANLSAKIVFSFDGRKKGGEMAGEEITSLALNLVQDGIDDSISIKTREGTTISHEEIRVSAQRDLPCSGNSISKLDAWQIMIDYLKELRSRGILSQ
jgi:hypothetical protein